ncbi:MAG: T9SS type A sorting domain-containing protein [Chitinophagaceae bacterium]
MKKFSTLLIFTFLLVAAVFAAPPTVPSSNLSFSSIDGAQFTGNYTSGNGTSRIVVIKQGSPVTGLPVNGVEYTPNSIFGTAGSQFTAPGEYVVARTGWSTFSVSGLQPGTVYYVAIFEYNGTTTNTQYLALPLTGSQSTVIAPTTQVPSISSTGVTGNTMTLSFTKGNGTGRIVIARKGSAVNANPVDLTNYWSDEIFGSGTKLGTDNYVVYKGTGTSVVVKNLEPNTIYHFTAFEYNGSISPVQLVPGTVASATTNAGPTIASSSAGFNYVEGNSFSISVTQGNGKKRLFIAKKGTPVTAVPVNGINYTANAVFGTAGTEIAPDEYVVYASTGSGVNITNLEPNTTYHFRVYDYDADNANNTYYLTGSYAVKSGSTASTPSAIASNLTMSSLTGSSASVSFTPGNGSYRMVIMKAGSPVDAVPVNLIRYSANAVFGSGTQITPGNYVMHSGMNGAVFSVSNLQPGITYYISIYEFNGSTAPVYSASGATHSFTVPVEPSAASTSPWTAFAEGASFRLIWTNGNGAKRIVVVKKGSAVTAKPVDKTIYTANAAFGQGQALAAGEYIVYNGSASEVNLTNLEIAGNYHFAVFEYNTGADGLPDYLTTSWLATSAATVSWPTTQTTISSVSGLQSTQATVNFTKGNGANRIFIMKQGSAVSADPQDYVKYAYNTAFGTSSTLISNGNYVVAITNAGGNLTFTNLQPNTVYHVSAFEYNGSNEPAYLRTVPATYSFTTPDAPGATTPTIAASNAAVNVVEGNKFTFKWTNGNGEKRIVVMKKGSAVSFVPANATSYTANAVFGSGADMGGGQYIVHNSNANSVDVTNLEPSVNYYFAVYEYNGTGTLLRYLTSSVLTASAGTAFAPTTAASTVVTGTTPGKLIINWTNGNGAGRLVVMKEGSAVNAIPVNLSSYPANAIFKTGSQIAAGEYVVYSGTGNTVTVTGLENKTYHFRIFEFNGTSAPVYNTTAVTAGSAIVSAALPVKLLYFTARESNGNAVLSWATAKEVNNNYFVIERSFDGSHFEPIKNIAGAGNSNTTTEYSYTDAVISNNKAYYRLKQVDNDGNINYSSVAAISLKNEAGNIHIYPNPVKDRFRLSLPQPLTEGTMLVYNGSGILIHRQKVADGQYVNAGSWANGVYYIKVEAGGKEYQGRLVKSQNTP